MSERVLTRQPTSRAISSLFPPRKISPMHRRAGTSLAFVIMTVVLRLRCPGLLQRGSRVGSCGLGVWRCWVPRQHAPFRPDLGSECMGCRLRNSTPALSFSGGACLNPTPSLRFTKLMRTGRAASMGRGRSVVSLRTHLQNRLGDE